jgi:hypothetical protein
MMAITPNQNLQDAFSATIWVFCIIFLIFMIIGCKFMVLFLNEILIFFLFFGLFWTFCAFFAFFGFFVLFVLFCAFFAYFIHISIEILTK